MGNTFKSGSCCEIEQFSKQLSERTESVLQPAEGRRAVATTRCPVTLALGGVARTVTGRSGPAPSSRLAQYPKSLGSFLEISLESCSSAVEMVSFPWPTPPSSARIGSNNLMADQI